VSAILISVEISLLFSQTSATDSFGNLKEKTFSQSFVFAVIFVKSTVTFSNSPASYCFLNSEIATSLAGSFQYSSIACSQNIV
jgi:hypothetical protein